MHLNMRKTLAVLAILIPVCLNAQNEIKRVNFVEPKDMPQSVNFLPSPPELEDPLFFNDWVEYVKGKELRSTERGQLAVEDAATTLAYYMKRFGEAMETDINPKDYPLLASYILSTYTTIRASIQVAKDTYARVRPYNQFHEGTPVPEHESPDDRTSYPSGHTTRAWAIALALVSVDPAHQDAILKTGYEIGQSRVIVGFHYQSDVDAARLAASAGFARLVCEPAFQTAMADAREEFETKRK